MASYTPNLDLLKKSPVTDGDDMFNVETMLNENWDRIDRGVGDYTAPAQKMGLTGDLSVGASLGVLADIGNVHVWRKTVVAEEEVPAGYKLVDDNTDRTLNDVPNALINLGNTNQRTAYINCADSITVDDGGGISLNSATTHYQANDALNAASWLRGKYIKLYYINDFGNWFGPPALDQNKTYYVPNDAQISVNSATIIVNKLQRVDAYPLTPAGTHITYLTSTNRNAYQEGDDAKEAGYVLGEVVAGKTPISMAYDGRGVVIGSTIQVEENGAISFAPDSGATQYWPNSVDVSLMKGKFFHTVGGEGDSDEIGNFSDPNYWVYLPEDAVITRESPVGSSTTIFTTKYQPVTGYPAIPAGITIEYLGVLGDKIRMQIVSYIGTGTSGEATPCSITADFEFKTAEYLGSLRGGSLSPAVTYIDARDKVLSEAITTEFTAYSGFCLDDSQDSFGKKSEDGKNITWYSRYNNRQSNQLNEAGVKYYFRFFG